jgi:hypothetical protein
MGNGGNEGRPFAGERRADEIRAVLRQVITLSRCINKRFSFITKEASQ